MTLTFPPVRLLLPMVLLVGCATVQTVGQLDDIKEAYQAGNYEAVATRTLDCPPTAEGCNQQHLLKGNACLILAGQEEATDRYRCAVDHLREGIRLTRDWQMEGPDLQQTATYENLAQALQELRDDVQGQERLTLTRELEDTALELRGLAPDSVAAVYYLNSARLSLLLAEMARGEIPLDACQRLEASQGELRGFELAAAGSDRYREPYRQLQVDVFSARRAVPGCGR